MKKFGVRNQTKDIIRVIVFVINAVRRFVETAIMPMLKRIFYGLCIGLSMVLFQKYFWSVVRPIFIDGRIDRGQKPFLLVALIFVDLLVAIIGIYYERREILGVANVDRKKKIVRIGFLILLIFVSSLAFSVAMEF